MPRCCAIFTPRPDRTSCLCTVNSFGDDEDGSFAFEADGRLDFRARVDVRGEGLGSGLTAGPFRVTEAMLDSSFCGEELEPTLAGSKVVFFNGSSQL